MKNTRLKNVIFTAGMAVFTGVLLLGVNAAIGVSAPEVNPSDAVGVSPTFTGLDVQGMVQNTSANNGGGVVVDDNLQITGSTWIDDLIVQGVSTFDGAVTIDGDFESRGGNFRGVVGNSDGDFYVDDNMTIDGTLNLTGNLSDSFGSLTVADDFVITGTSNLQGNVTFNGNIASDEDTLLVNDMLRVGGGLIIDGPRSRFDGEFINVNAVLRANESIINMANGGDDPVLIDDDLTISNGRTLLNQGNMETWGYAGFAGDIRMDLYESEDGDITGVDDIQLHGEISNPVPNADVIVGDDLTVTDDVTINDDLTVVGAAKASRFGTVTVRYTDRTNVNNLSNVSLNQPCNAGEELLSCGANTFNSDFAWDFNKNFFIKAVYPWTNDTCYGRARNESGVAKKFSVYAVCLDPDL